MTLQFLFSNIQKGLFEGDMQVYIFILENPFTITFPHTYWYQYLRIRTLIISIITL